MTTAPPATVRCRALDGTAHVLRLTAAGETTTDGALPSRLVTVDDGPPMLQKWVPRTPEGRPGGIGPLDREIRAGHRFAQVFRPNSYPRELPHLWYYDVDSEDPFLLLAPYRGVPVTQVLPGLDEHDRRNLQVGLLRALHFAGLAGVTHGRVGLDALHWDAGTGSVQLIGFEHATMIGEWHPGAPGGGSANLRDDVWDAGLTIWRTAHPAHRGRDAPDLSTDGGALAAMLAAVFVNPPAARPTPGDLLATLREPSWIPLRDFGARWAPGLRAFESEVRRKRARTTVLPASGAVSWRPRFRELLRSPAAAHRDAEPQLPALVRCPVCLDSYPPPDDGLWRRDDEGKYHQITQDARDSLKEGLTLVSAYRRCPNPSEDTNEHFLPANYFAHDPPLVVVMAGRPTAGKTHLLTAMIREIVERGGLTPYGLGVVPMDLHRHDAYRTSFLEPAARGEQLPETAERLTDPAAILLLRSRHGTRPLVLFDVAGEDLQAVGDGELARFLVGTDAVLFVHGVDPVPDRRGDQALEMSLARFQAVPRFERLPAAIVVTKADRLRYQPPVNRWLQPGNEHLTSLDPGLVHRESRDVYAFLHQREEHSALAPFSVFDRCTLHFASASGSDAAADRPVFPRGFEPSRVLQPLVSLLAMSGMIESAGTPELGT